MAKRVWNGGTGDWFDAANWTTTTTDPSGAPLPGDAVIISSGTVSLPGPEAQDNGTFDADAITLGTPGGPLTTLDATDAILNRFLPITAIGSAAIIAHGVSTLEDGIALADAGATLLLGSGPNGSEAGDLVLTRTAGVSVSAGGTLDLEGAVTIQAGAGFTIPTGAAVINNAAVAQIGTSTAIQGSLTGTGSWDLRFSTNLTFEGSVSAGQTVNFGGVDGGLRLASPASFSGAITGFSPGDLIDLPTVSATNAVYDAAAGTLSVDNGPGTATVATLARVQAADNALVATPDGSGGTLISYANTPTRLQYGIAGADKAMRSDAVRSSMTVPGTATPITGAGVKVGIISTSFDIVKPGSANADAAAGYLPETAAGTSAVTLLSEGTAGSDDEGRAMAELIHQVAPGAQLFFGTGSASQPTMAASIKAMVSAGCSIIVDDLTFADAAAYQTTGVVDAAVAAALAGGVDYFTSAGNYGDAFLERAFAPASTTLPDGSPADAQVFDNGSAYDRITVPANVAARLDLQWTAPYEGAGNAGAPDALTFKVFSPSGTLVATSAQRREGVATTDVSAQLASQTAAADYLIAVYLNGGQVQPGEFKLFLTSSGATGTGPGGVIDDPQASSGSGDLRGQQLIPGVNTVGATFYGNSAAFGQMPSATEYFSDSGPGTLLYDSNGVPLPAPQSAGKVDFTAPDGVNTSVPGFAGFFGTSAAAPDAAAVAALMLQANPALTTSQVTTSLEKSAISLGEEPQTVQGAGLIQADRAVVLAEQAAVPPGNFLYTDLTTGMSGTATGDAYTGPVAGLTQQYIWASSDGVAVAATVGNVFLHGGSGDDALAVSSGSNVLDGGGGSNFLTGATGADGGSDTFFVDGRGGGTTWSTAVNFHHGDAVTVFGFQDGISTRPWSALDGAVGYQGATIHSELGGAGTGVNDSITFAGVSLADAQAKFTTSTGTVGGASYLQVAYTG